MKFLIFLFLMILSPSLLAQDYDYNEKDQILLKKFYKQYLNIQKENDNAKSLNYINNVYDDIKSKELKLELSFLKISLYEKMSNYEAFYKELLHIENILEKIPNNTILKIRAQLIKMHLKSSLFENDEASLILDEVEKTFTPELRKKYPDVASDLYLLGFYLNTFKEDFPKAEQYAFKNYQVLNSIDTTKIFNYIQIANISIANADYIDSKDQKESFKLYKKANRFAHKYNDLYFINFSRMRIAGCLINLNKEQQALDTLYAISNSNNDFGITMLHYYTYINAFEKLNQPDSVKFYKFLIDESSAFQEDVISDYKKKRLIEESISKVNSQIAQQKKWENILTISLLIAVILGVITVFIVVVKINKK